VELNIDERVVSLKANLVREAITDQELGKVQKAIGRFIAELGIKRVEALPDVP